MPKNRDWQGAKMKTFFTLLVLTAYLNAGSDICKIQWILSDGVIQKPSASMKTITLVDFDRDDRKIAELQKQLSDLERTPNASAEDAARQEGKNFMRDFNVGGYADSEAAIHEKAKRFHGLDGVKLKSKNEMTSYPFAGFIDSDNGKFAISYKSQDGTILDRFQDGTIFLKKDGVQILKATCPKI